MRSEWGDKVKHILEMDSEARDDDFILYLDVCKRYTDVPVWAVSFEEAMINRKEYGLPSYEAITRARRRVQQKYPELRGNRYEKRMERQADFLDEYARDYR